jgi:hypothetical protein
VWSREGRWEFSDDRDMEALERAQQMYMITSDRFVMFI